MTVISLERISQALSHFTPRWRESSNVELAPLWPWADSTNHLRPYTLAGTGALLALALAARMSGAAWGSAALTAVNIVLLLLPLQWSAETSRGQTLAPHRHRDLKIVTFNMAWTRRPVDNVARFLLQEDADILLLQEVTQTHAAALDARLKTRYPFSHACAVFQGCTQAMFAQRPWTSVRHVYRTTGNPEMIWARFDDPELGRFRVYSLHVAWPFTPETQARHVDRLIALSRSIAEPAIFAGDFNMTPWSYQFQRLLASSGLRRHAIFLRSWPTDSQFRLPDALQPEIAHCCRNITQDGILDRWHVCATTARSSTRTAGDSRGATCEWPDCTSHGFNASLERILSLMRGIGHAVLVILRLIADFVGGTMIQGNANG